MGNCHRSTGLSPGFEVAVALSDWQGSFGASASVNSVSGGLKMVLRTLSYL